jgi:hypothetical protein
MDEDCYHAQLTRAKLALLLPTSATGTGVMLPRHGRRPRKATLKTNRRWPSLCPENHSHALSATPSASANIRIFQGEISYRRGHGDMVGEAGPLEGMEERGAVDGRGFYRHT